MDTRPASFPPEPPPDDTPAFAARHGVTAEAIAARLFAAHGDRIRVKKPKVAVPNLARLLAAALDIAGRKGFHSMSMRDLAEASGLSMGALYTYIQDKDTLLSLILDAVTEAVERVLAPLETGEEDPRRRLAGLIHRHVLLSDAMQPWFAFAYMEVKAFHREARDHTIAQELATERLFADAIAAGMRAGVYRADDPVMAAALVKPLLQDWYLKRWKHRRRGTTPDAYAATVTAFVERALGVDGATRGLDLKCNRI